MSKPLEKQVGGSHYKDMAIQPITYITENKLDWYQGNIVKYASRHHFKNGAEDLKKVIHYAEMALEAQYPKAKEELPPIIDNKTSCPPSECPYCCGPYGKCSCP